VTAKTTSLTKRIVAFYESHEWSYQLVADHFGVSRNTVAGAIFRHKNPLSKRIAGKDRSKNMVGRGRHGPGPIPKYTAYESSVKMRDAA
jgi:transposase